MVGKAAAAAAAAAAAVQEGSLASYWLEGGYIVVAVPRFYVTSSA